MLHSARTPAHHTPVLRRTHGETGGWGVGLAVERRQRQPFQPAIKSKIKNKAKVQQPLGTFFVKSCILH